jgi:hypothetical protein
MLGMRHHDGTAYTIAFAEARSVRGQFILQKAEVNVTYLT